LYHRGDVAVLFYQPSGGCGDGLDDALSDGTDGEAAAA
jgi:hypothetical protein